jgi:hypothetical protein
MISVLLSVVGSVFVGAEEHLVSVLGQYDVAVVVTINVNWVTVLVCLFTVHVIFAHSLSMLTNLLFSSLSPLLRGGGVADGYIEVRPKGVSKGLFLEHCLNLMKSAGSEADFVLAIGDDTSDEPMFDRLVKIQGQLHHTHLQVRRTGLMFCDL